MITTLKETKSWGTVVEIINGTGVYTTAKNETCEFKFTCVRNTLQAIVF